MSVLSAGASTLTGSAAASAYASVNETQAVLDAAEASVKRLLAAREHVAEPNMRIVVHILSSDQQHCVPFQSILMSVGQGMQTFKWLSLAVGWQALPAFRRIRSAAVTPSHSFHACDIASLQVATRLRCFAATKRGFLRSHDRHELSGFFLPTAINTARNAKARVNPCTGVRAHDFTRTHPRVRMHASCFWVCQWAQSTVSVGFLC